MTRAWGNHGEEVYMRVGNIDAKLSPSDLVPHFTVVNVKVRFLAIFVDFS